MKRIIIAAAAAAIIGGTISGVGVHFLEAQKRKPERKDSLLPEKLFLKCDVVTKDAQGKFERQSAGLLIMGNHIHGLEGVTPYPDGYYIEPEQSTYRQWTFTAIKGENLGGKDKLDDVFDSLQPGYRGPERIPESIGTLDRVTGEIIMLHSPYKDVVKTEETLKGHCEKAEQKF